MKETKTTMTKLTTAQAYALQVKADKRARAIENRDPVIAADNARINAMFAADQKVAQRKAAKSNKKVRWTGAEFDFAIEVYLQFTVKGKVAVNNPVAVANFQDKFGNRNYGAVNMLFGQIRGLDNYAPQEGLTDTSQALVDKLYAVDPERFPGGAIREEKVLNAIDNLLAELR
jgi:hypothetical protein